MSKAHDRRIWIGAGDRLSEGAYLRTEVVYAGNPTTILVFRFKGRCYAYRNLCVHMPRELDCEKDMIFDTSGQFLRCSMHGIVYDPLTGASLSTMCTGKRLTPIGIIEDQEGIWIKDKKVK